MIEVKKGRAYDSRMRMAVYTAVQSNVPVDKAPEVIRHIAESFSHQKLKVVPTPKTVCRVARELSSLCDVKAGEALSRAKCPLAWDATDL